MPFRQRLQGIRVARPEGRADARSRVGEGLRVEAGKHAAGELHGPAVGPAGDRREVESVVRCDLPRVVAREIQQEFRLRRVRPARARDQMTDEIDIVRVEQRPQALRREVTVAVVHLVEVLDHMAPPRPAPRPLDAPAAGL